MRSSPKSFELIRGLRSEQPIASSADLQSLFSQNLNECYNNFLFLHELIEKGDDSSINRKSKTSCNVTPENNSIWIFKMTKCL